METEIIHKELKFTVYGFSGTAVNNNFAETGFKLMNKMWETIRSNSLKHKGINTWVYGPDGKMFTGVELENTPESSTGLDVMEIRLTKYAYYKHIGPYSKLSVAYSTLKDGLKRKNLDTCFPWLEIYGHWDNDESKLETEILMCIK